MTNWQLTETTIYCDAVDDEVSIQVYKDGSVKCIGYIKYGKPTKETANTLNKQSKHLKRQLACAGPECHRVTQYQEKLLSQEPR